MTPLQSHLITASLIVIAITLFVGFLAVILAMSECGGQLKKIAENVEPEYIPECCDDTEGWP